jgi:hypothetical protein
MGTIRFNPMRETVLPKDVKPPEETHAYSLAEHGPGRNTRVRHFSLSLGM